MLRHAYTDTKHTHKLTLTQEGRNSWAKLSTWRMSNVALCLSLFASPRLSLDADAVFLCDVAEKLVTLN